MPRKKESPYNIVVGRKRKHDVRLQIQVSANTATKLKEMAIGQDIRIPEQVFLEALETPKRSKVIVPSSVPSGFANEQFGDAYGVDWEYEPQAEPVRMTIAEVCKVNPVFTDLPFKKGQDESAQIGSKEDNPFETILQEAERIIYGDREAAYGNPRFNLDTIAQFWSTYLDRKFPIHVQQCGAHFITAEDVAQLMILLKTSRLIHNPTHRDSLVDQAGYAALQERIQGIQS